MATIERGLQIFLEWAKDPEELRAFAAARDLSIFEGRFWRREVNPGLKRVVFDIRPRQPRQNETPDVVSLPRWWDAKPVLADHAFDEPSAGGGTDVMISRRDIDVNLSRIQLSIMLSQAAMSPFPVEHADLLGLPDPLVEGRKYARYKRLYQNLPMRWGDHLPADGGRP